MIRKFISGVAMFLAPIVANAQGDTICHTFSADLERLACYDEQTQYIAPEATLGSVATAALPVVSQWVVEQEVSALDGRVDVWERLKNLCVSA